MPHLRACRVREARSECPLCGTPWISGNPTGTCDHEADWYREWLALAVEAMDDPSFDRFHKAINRREGA